MGFQKSKRPILAPGLAIATPGSLSTSAGSVSGDVDVQDAVRSVSVTMTGALVMPTEAITLAAGDQAISGVGISVVTLGTSGAGRDAVIAAPAAVGINKHIVLINNTTSVDCAIHTNATANVFWGTTYNTATVSGASTGSPGGTPAGTVSLNLFSISTSQWALQPGSTFNWDLSASTGSTGIA